MEVKYIILLCLVVVRQTSGWWGGEIAEMADDVEENCLEAEGGGKDLCSNIGDIFEYETDDDGTECNHGFDTYQQTINTQPPVSSPSTMLLWSGCGMKEKADEISERNHTYLTVDLTTVGASFMNMRWKQDPDDDDDIIYFEQEEAIRDFWKSDSCPSPFEYVFWALLSEEFARRADGVVHVILSAKTSGGPFDSNSIFAKFEVENLPRRNPPITVRVYLYDADTRSKKCDHDDSIQKLKEKVLEKDNKFECFSGKQPPADYEKPIVLSSYSQRYDGTKCGGGFTMKFSTHILVGVSCVHLFIN